MTKVKNILNFSLLVIFCLQLFGFIYLVVAPNQTRAADPTFTPQIGIPGSNDFGPGKTFTFSTKSTKPIGLYIQEIYKYAIGIVGILATVVLMVGGVVWLTAGGNPTRIGEAKAYIGASLTGLILALSSYLILATINPALVNFKESAISQVASDTSNNKGCCDKTKTAGSCDIVTKDQCDGNWYGETSGIYGCNDQNQCQKVEAIGCCVFYYEYTYGFWQTGFMRQCYSQIKEKNCSYSSPDNSLFDTYAGTGGLVGGPKNKNLSLDTTDPTCTTITTCNYIDGTLIKDPQK